MSATSHYLESLSRDMGRSEEDVLAEAVRTGLREMWRQQLLGRYLRGEIDRTVAIEEVGLDSVDLADRQAHAMREDLAWGQQGN
jgi:hypothetical protein